MYGDKLYGKTVLRFFFYAMYMRAVGAVLMVKLECS